MLSSNLTMSHSRFETGRPESVYQHATGPLLLVHLGGLESEQATVTFACFAEDQSLGAAPLGNGRASRSWARHGLADAGHLRHQNGGAGP